MRYFLLVVVMATACCLTYVKDVEAFGLGITSTYGLGTAKHTYESNTFGVSNQEFNYDTNRISIGMVMDTNLSKDSLFNYRLGVAYEKEKLKRIGFEYETRGISFENDFGFRLFKNDSLRIWAGPELRIAILEKEWGDGTSTSFGEFGVGPVVGVNFNLGPLVTLSAKGGFIFNTIVGERTNIGFSDTDIDGDGKFPFINFALIFRIGER